MLHTGLKLRAALGAALIPATASPQLFGPPTSQATPMHGKIVAVGDLDHDGNLDFATASRFTDKLYLWFGTGDGGFRDRRALSAGRGARGVAIADTNRDGNLDLLVANSGDNEVLVRLGDGLGEFPRVRRSAIPGTGPQTVSVGDVNGDGIPDIVVPNISSSDVAILLGNGRGQFDQAITRPTGTHPQTGTLADVDGDGDLDILTANFTSQDITILRGNGTGGFVTTPALPIGVGGPVHVAVGDVDLDGRPDVVTANGRSDDLFVFLGQRSGFSPPARLSTTGSVVHVVIADVDADGQPDILGAGSVGLVVFLGQGAGRFGSGQVFPSGGSPSSLTIGDVDGDGAPDILAPDYDGGVSVVPNLKLPPTGTQAYGTGTTGCRGTLGIAANATPTIGQSSFAITCTNTPTDTAGTLWFSPTQAVAGFDIVGIRIHVGPDVLIPLEMRSDASGVAFAEVPIPNLAGLRGAQVFAQSVWLVRSEDGDGCTTSPIGGVSSRGIAVTIQ